MTVHRLAIGRLGGGSYLLSDQQHDALHAAGEDHEHLPIPRGRTPDLALVDDPIAGYLAEPREVYLVAGGTPAALALRDRLDDPAFRAAIEASIRRFAESLRIAYEAALPVVLEQARILGEFAERTRQHLRDAGVLPEEPPSDPRARALWLRQHRGTGPGRQVQQQHRPRRVE